MKKYIKVFTANISLALIYRAELFIMFLREILMLFGILFLWRTVFNENAEKLDSDFASTALYYIIVLIISTSTTLDLSTRIGEQIRTGFFSNQLLKPYRIVFSEVVTELAKKISEIVLIVPIYILAIILIANSFSYEFKVSTMIYGFAFIIMALVFNIFVDLSIGWITFWVDSVWWFKHVKAIFGFIFGGKLFPLFLLTGKLEIIARFLPFRHIFFTPTMYFLGDRGAESFLKDIFHFSVWILVAFVVGNLLWMKGIKKYGAFGN